MDLFVGSGVQQHDGVGFVICLCGVVCCIHLCVFAAQAYDAQH